MSILKFIYILLAVFIMSTSYAEESNDNSSMPTGRGFPINVHTALYYIHIESFDDDAGTFEAFTDLRLSWEDSRLRYPAAEGLNGYKEYRGDKAETELAKIWTPRIEYTNRLGETSFIERRLRVYPNGRVETMTRTNAMYKTPINVTRFPFDHQPLQVKIALREDSVDLVKLVFSQDDVLFSRVARNAYVNGWILGLVNLQNDFTRGWNGERYSLVTVSLDIERKPLRTFSTIFIPLFASLLIPFVVIWMNKVEDGSFKLEAFELANVITGGLFAVIGLSFSINSEYTMLGTNENTVTHLFALNYALLAISLTVVVVFFRYNFVKLLFGAYIQEQLFIFITWAFPLLSVSAALVFILVAAA